MSQTVSVGGAPNAPRSLSYGSLLKRALFGVLGLLFGVFAAAWVLHSSIDAKPSAANVGAVNPAPTTVNKQ